jgi:hypothetical protein
LMVVERFFRRRSGKPLFKFLQLGTAGWLGKDLSTAS